MTAAGAQMICRQQHKRSNAARSIPRGRRYTRTAMSLHWVMAVLLPTTFALGLYMKDMSFSPQKLSFYSYHKWIGVTIFVLAVIRVAWRMTHRPPEQNPALPSWSISAASAAHILMYALFFAIPLAGWLYSSATGVPTVPFGLSALQLPDLINRNMELAHTLKLVHQSLAYLLAGLVVTHLAGVVLHIASPGHDVLGRMLPGRRP